MLNASDSEKMLGKSKLLSKGGVMTEVWNDVVNFMKLEEYTENKYGWWSTVMLESNWKQLAITTVCRIVDASTKSVNSCEVLRKTQSLISRCNLSFRHYVPKE